MIASTRNFRRHIPLPLPAKSSMVALDACRSPMLPSTLICRRHIVKGVVEVTRSDTDSTTDYGDLIDSWSDLRIAPSAGTHGTGGRAKLTGGYWSVSRSLKVLRKAMRSASCRPLSPRSPFRSGKRNGRSMIEGTSRPASRPHSTISFSPPFHDQYWRLFGCTPGDICMRWISRRQAFLRSIAF